MEFFTNSDYRKLIQYLIEREKSKGVECTFSKLADAIRIQKPYMSKIMNGMADLSEDQLHLLCEYFSIDGEEKDYFELLLKFSKSALRERKDTLKKQILKIQSIKLDLKNNIEAEKISDHNPLFNEYFLDPHMQIVHVALNIKRFQNIDKLSQTLQISKNKISEILKKLENLKLIEFKNNRYHVTNQSLHLPKESNLFHPQQSLIRIKSIEQQQAKSIDSGNYSFSVTFSCDETGRKKIQEDFIKYLKSVQKTVQSSGTEEVFQINFDLFSWTK